MPRQYEHTCECCGQVFHTFNGFLGVDFCSPRCEILFNEDEEGEEMQEPVQLKVKKLHPDAILPTYATDGSACFDLYAVFQPSDYEAGYVDSESYRPYKTFGTGLSFEVPEGWAMMIYSRSGHGFINNVRLANCVGVIDSDYRGEVCVKLTADQDGFLNVDNGYRIAQAMLIPVPKVELIEVEELSETVRGAGGFGSTGA